MLYNVAEFIHIFNAEWTIKICRNRSRNVPDIQLRLHSVIMFECLYQSSNIVYTHAIRQGYPLTTLFFYQNIKRLISLWIQLF